MLLKTTFCVFICLGFSNFTLGQNKQYSQDSFRVCSKVIDEIGYFWKLDSLANNGFRRCAAKGIVESKLDRVSKAMLITHLGKPNSISEKFNGDIEFLYYYFDILAMPKDYKAPLATG
ncbi:MAG: hypothetical protein ACK4E0_17805 [Chitinophagaceae bacterium]